MWLSVIMPVYNSKNTIEPAIKSVLEQEDVELIVIDAGSTDGTVDIIAKYSSQISYWVSEKDNGYADALNKGISHAKCEYVMMLAADDRLVKRGIEKARSSIQNDTEIWVGALLGHDERGFSYIESDPILEHLETGCTLRHPATIFRKTVFSKYGMYNDQYKCAADWEIFLRAWKQGAVYQVEPIVVVIFEKSGMSSKNCELVIRETKQIAEKYGLPYSENEVLQGMIPKAEKVQIFLAKLGLLPTIYKLAGVPDGCLTKKRVKEYMEG